MDERHTKAGCRAVPVGDAVLVVDKVKQKPAVELGYGETYKPQNANIDNFSRRLKNHGVQLIVLHYYPVPRFLNCLFGAFLE